MNRQCCTRWNEALAEARKARQLDPLSPIVNAWIGWGYSWHHDFTAAVSEPKQTLELFPDFAPAQFYLAEAYQQLDNPREAVLEMEKQWPCPMARLSMLRRSRGLKLRPKT